MNENSVYKISIKELKELMETSVDSSIKIHMRQQYGFIFLPFDQRKKKLKLMMEKEVNAIIEAFLKKKNRRSEEETASSS